MDDVAPRKRGRPRIHDSAAARKDAYRKANEVCKLTIEVPIHDREHVKAYAASLRQLARAARIVILRSNIMERHRLYGMLLTVAPDPLRPSNIQLVDERGVEWPEYSGEALPIGSQWQLVDAARHPTYGRAVLAVVKIVPAPLFEDSYKSIQRAGRKGPWRRRSSLRLDRIPPNVSR